MLTKQAKTKTQGNLGIKINTSSQTTSFHTPLNSEEDGKCILDLMNFGVYHSVCKITKKDNKLKVQIREEDEATNRGELFLFF